MPAARVGRLTVDAIRANRFWVFTHPESRALVAARHAEIQAAYDELVAAWQAFAAAMTRASELGIDAQAVIAQQMRAAVSEEDWNSLPAPVRMMLG